MEQGFRQHDYWNPDQPSWGISPLDAAQLLTKAIEVPVATLNFGILHAVSRHRRSWLELGGGQPELVPVDDGGGSLWPHPPRVRVRFHIIRNACI